MYHNILYILVNYVMIYIFYCDKKTVFSVQY